MQGNVSFGALIYVKVNCYVLVLCRGIFQTTHFNIITTLYLNISADFYTMYGICNLCVTTVYILLVPVTCGNAHNPF